MKTAIITGGSGMIGQRLTTILKEQGYKPLILTRNRKKVLESDMFIHWDIANNLIDDRLSEANFIINLAGEGIADSRWTKKRKDLILQSRVNSTQLIISEIRRRKIKLDGFISVSAIGYYGHGGDRLLNEDSGVITKEFLSEVCVQWEQEASLVGALCESFSILRIGTVLSSTGGALEKMDKSIPFGIASYFGDGKQFMSWIHIDDLCGMIIHAMTNNLDGIFNAVAPDCMTNKEFTAFLRNAVNPKAILLGTPAIALKLALGEMSSVILNSSRVDATKIQKSGYKFKYPLLSEALAALYTK